MPGMEIFRAWNTGLKCYSACKGQDFFYQLKFQSKACIFPTACCFLSSRRSLWGGRPSSCPRGYSTCNSGQLSIYSSVGPLGGHRTYVPSSSHACAFFNFWQVCHSCQRGPPFNMASQPLLMHKPAARHRHSQLAHSTSLSHSVSHAGESRPGLPSSESRTLPLWQTLWYILYF